MNEAPREQGTNQGRRLAALEPYQFKPGQSGNPGGRPKGPTLKVWAQEQIKNMPDEERIAFLKRIPPEIIWRMAEGNPTEDKNISISVPRPILGGLSQGDTKVIDAPMEGIEGHLEANASVLEAIAEDTPPVPHSAEVE